LRHYCSNKPCRPLRVRDTLAEPADELNRAAITVFRGAKSFQAARQLIFIVRQR